MILGDLRILLQVYRSILNFKTLKFDIITQIQTVFININFLNMNLKPEKAKEFESLGTLNLQLKLGAFESPNP